MFTALKAIYNLQWTPQRKYHPLPAHIERSSIPTPNGDLELLISHPSQPISTHPPLILAHGGFGHASVWLEWMSYFHEHGYGGTVYSYSARGHGASYPVSYLQMVWSVSLDDVAADWASVIQHVKHEREAGAEPVLIAHSAGGALTQYVLLNRMATARGLCLVGSIPHFGGYDAYWNWAKLDPWFFLRSVLSGGHPTSPLSHPALVHKAFFGPRYPSGLDDGWARVKEFMKWMAPYESMSWAMAMNGSLWRWLWGRNEWLSVGSIISSIEGWQTSSDRVCVMVGSHDRLMNEAMARRQFKDYADAAQALRDEKERVVGDSLVEQPLDFVDGVFLQRANGIRLVIVEDAGHHTQNDVQSEIAAKACLDWLEQI